MSRYAYVLQEALGNRASRVLKQSVRRGRNERDPGGVPSGYVEGESCFSAGEKQYGRPCTRWEVARIVALMTPNRLCVIVPAQQTVRPARMREH
jgi:hypothetical protein